MNYTVIQNFLNSFYNVNEFIITMIHFDSEKQKFRYPADRQRVNNSLKYFSAKNVEGYNIYIRPNTYSVILLDDIERKHLAEIAKLKPCCLVETSPQNYQVWLQLDFEPTDREHALKICRKLAEMFEADKGSAEPDHVGRLPSYTNRKEKYKKDGLFPYVLLHKFEKRFSTLTKEFAQDYILYPNDNQKKTFPNKVVRVLKENKTGADRSREDFNTCCMLIRQKKTDDYIRNYLEIHSQKAGNRRDDYTVRTIRNARKRLGIYT